MRSSFRIDKNRSSSVKGPGVQLPSLEELLERERELKKRRAPEQDPSIDAEIPDDWRDPAQTEHERLESQLLKMRTELEQMRAEAHEIVAAANLEADSIREKARIEGYDQARIQANDELKAETDRLRQEMNSLLDGLRSAAEEHERELEAGILTVALAVAEKILRSQLEHNDEAYPELVRETCTMLNGDIEKVLHVSNEDFGRYFADAASPLRGVLSNVNAKVMADGNLKPGDCLLTSEFGAINTGVRGQLERLRENLAEA